MTTFAKYFFNRFSRSNYTPVKSVFTQPKFLLPLSNIHSFAIKSYFAVIPFIVRLFVRCSPFYIFGKISETIVNPFNCVFRRRPGTNCLVKLGKRVDPSITDFNTSPTIVLKVLILGISAAIFYVLPNKIFSGFTFSMSKMAKFGSFSLNASTTCCMLITQTFSAGYFSVSTSAFTNPLHTSIWRIFHTINDSESSESLSCKVDECRHNVTSWLRVVVEKVCWKAVNQSPLFGSYPIQHGVY